MTTTELKHQVQLQKWSAAVRDCRSSKLTVRQWCREHGITPTTYYRWERELLKISGEASSLAETAPIAFAELPAPKRVCRNGSECSAALQIGSACIEFHQELNAELFEDHGQSSAVMLNDFNGADKVYIACGYTDLRKGIDGLATLVEQKFKLGPFSNTLFLFCGRRRDRIKGLYWEGDGFVLLYKRLECGEYQWPRTADEVHQITPQQYRWLMEGLRLEQPKAHRPVTGLSMA